MSRGKRIRIEDVVDYFGELEDPRTSINIKHPLVSVVVIAMMGVLFLVVLWKGAGPSRAEHPPPGALPPAPEPLRAGGAPPGFGDAAGLSYAGRAPNGQPLRAGTSVQAPIV